MKVLVTGADGFVGNHVVSAALSAGHEVQAVYRALPETPRHGVTSAWAADLTREWPVDDVPDGIVHLASLAAVGRSFDAPQDYIGGNTAMLTHLAEALLAAGATSTRVIVVSTGALYRPGPGACDESRPLVMSSPYAVSKAAVELQCDYYRSRGLDIVVARPFNHIGPGQLRGFIVPDLMSSVENLADDDEPLSVGNLDTRRDYTDVRDVAAAYLRILEAESSGPLYNIASGVSASGREILEAICRSLGRSIPRTLIDKSRLRPNDPAEIVGDASRLRDDMGWIPEIPLDRSILDFVDHARAQRRRVA